MDNPTSHYFCHLTGLPGLRRTACEALIATQPATVAEALAIADVGRKTTKYLLRVGLISDPEGMQRASLASRTRLRPTPHGLRRRAAPGIPPEQLGLYSPLELATPWTRISARSSLAGRTAVMNLSNLPTP